MIKSHTAQCSNNVYSKEYTNDSIFLYQLKGVFRGGFDVLVRSKLALSPEGGVTMQLSVRSGDAEVSELVASAVG